MVDHFKDIFELLTKLVQEVITIKEFEEQLVERKLDVNAKSTNTEVVPYKMMHRDNPDKILKLVWLSRKTPIVRAAATIGSLDVVKILHKRGADVGAADAAGNTALIVASMQGYANIVHALVAEMGVNINNNLFRDWSVLTEAVYFRKWNVVIVLTRLSPGTMSLRPKGSNHILKPQEMDVLLNSAKMLNVSVSNYCAVSESIDAMQDVVNTVRERKHATQATQALWNLEQTRYFLKRDNPNLFAKFARVTEEERFNVFLCIERTSVKHGLRDPNLWLILKEYI